MLAAIFQSDTSGQTPHQRISVLRDVAIQARADILVCPELFLSGYADTDSVQRFAEPVDGPSAQQIADIAVETSTAIVYGYPEQGGGKIYNAAQCFGSEGRSIANHRKLLLPPGFEADIFTPGNDLTLFEWNGVKFGLLICYDAEFPEAVRATAEAGAEAVLVPTALGHQWTAVAHRVIPARAFENGIYILYANHAGTEESVTYLGSSCIVSPDGTDLARAGDEPNVISAELQPAHVKTAQKRLPYHRDLVHLRHKLD